MLAQNVWISASAGSGKTKVLIDRFLMLLLDGTPPTKILCITFTKAAAAEMLQRITDELTIWASCDEQELIDRLTKLMGAQPEQTRIKLARGCFEEFIEARGEIHISTIHSFCQKLIERFPKECNLEPGYRVADEQLIKTIIAEARTSFLNDSAAFLDESIQYLFSDLSESKLDGLIDKIIAIHALAPNFFMTKDKFKLYAEGLRIEFKLPENYSPEEEVKSLIDEIKRRLETTQVARATDWLSQMAAKSSKEALTYLKSLFLTEKNTPRVRVLTKQESSPESQLLVSEIQSLLLAYLNTEASHKIHRQTLSFFSLGNFFMSHYVDVKNKHAVLDYGDIVYRGVALLRNGEASAWFLYHLNNRFHHLLVDEAQDLNKTQWELILILSNELFCNFEPDESKSIFVVGDPKQSIYSFQGASPLLFATTREDLQRLAERYKLQLVRSELNESFRSDPMILEFVDRVFRIIRNRNPEYFVEEAKHISNKKFEASSIELWPLVIPQPAGGEEQANGGSNWQALTEYKELESPLRILAKKIAVRIKELLQAGYLPSDIMILVRKRDRLMEQLIIELKSENIPISGVDRLVLNKSLAIQDLLALGRFVLSQYDDYNLACLLKSPIFAMTEEELFELCNRGDISLWESLSSQAKPAYKEIHSFLMSLLENKNNHRPYQFFAQLLEVLQFRTKFLSRFGLQLNEILDEFLNLCLEFESTQSTSLSLFIDWFAKTELEIKRDSYADSNEVRLMTVHASKGLQAKVVILPDTTSVPKYTRDGILYNAAIRKLIAYQGASDHDFIKGLLQITELQTLQEYYRLLYVALTRAAEKLILCGWSNTKKLNPDCWYALLEEAIASPHPSLRGATLRGNPSFPSSK
jgi:ATP-dependent helicase/nuclease subunit A